MSNMQDDNRLDESNILRTVADMFRQQGKFAWLQADKIDYISRNLNNIEESECAVNDINVGNTHDTKPIDQIVKMQALADLAKATQEALQEVQMSKKLIERYRNNVDRVPRVDENRHTSIFSMSMNDKQQLSSDSSTNSTQDDIPRYNIGYNIRPQTSTVKIRERDFDSSEDEKPVSKISRRERDWDDSSKDESLQQKPMPILRERDLDSSEDED